MSSLNPCAGKVVVEKERVKGYEGWREGQKMLYSSSVGGEWGVVDVGEEVTKWGSWCKEDEQHVGKQATVGTRGIVCQGAKLDLLHECGDQLENLFQVSCEPLMSSVAGEHPRRVSSIACGRLQVLALGFLSATPKRCACSRCTHWAHIFVGWGFWNVVYPIYDKFADFCLYCRPRVLECHIPYWWRVGQEWLSSTLVPLPSLILSYWALTHFL